MEDDVTGTNTEEGIWFQDGNGHGTHTAGTIGAVGDNGLGVVGVRNNPSLFRFHIGKGLSNEGSGYDSSIMQAVQGCVDSGARVVSMSLGGPSGSDIARQFYKEIYDQGVLIVAAAGNSGDTGQLYPASFPYIMSVAAVDQNFTRPGFSQCNSQVEIAGPGVDILSTVPNGYAFASGTSMACPHVAGVAAEVWARFPDCTNAQIRNVLLRSAKPIGEEEGCNRGYGWGLVQAKAAYDLLASEGCEAGGDASSSPSEQAVGGCKQNPDYVASDNPNKDKCVSGANALIPSGFAFGLALGLSIWMSTWLS
jgi:serine protease